MMRSDGLKLSVNPVPIPLWYFNLRELLPKSRWLKLRRELIAERGQRCETCGKEVEKSRNIHAHEVWEYDESQTPAVATLTGIELVCWTCHMCEHWGRLKTLVQRGVLQKRAITETINHFCRVNGVSQDEFEPHRKAAFTAFNHRSYLDWSVDWGPFADLVLEYYVELIQPERMTRKEVMALASGCSV